jgi:hypothetical protein
MLATDKYFNFQVFMAIKRLEQESKYVAVHYTHDKNGVRKIYRLTLTREGGQNLLNVKYMTVDDAHWNNKIIDAHLSNTTPAIDMPSGTPPAAILIKKAGATVNVPPSPDPEGGDVFKKAIADIYKILEESPGPQRIKPSEHLKKQYPILNDEK